MYAENAGGQRRSSRRGKQIGKYIMTKTIGSGNFSKVKVGVDCETGSSYAIKIIEKEQLVRERMEEQLKREISVLRSLIQPNIIRLYDVMQTTNHIYLVMELVDGGELFDKIVEAKALDEARARRYFQQLITGVYFCHYHGVAHRDLKPENLLLDKNDVLKISDFGLSNLQKSSTGDQRKELLQTVCGTPNYVAPEVLRERGYDGRKADIWSCGVILFVMLAGFLPFDDDNINALFTKIERGEFRYPRQFEQRARNLIDRMLTVDPNQRATLDEIINHPWFAVDYDRRVLAGAINGYGNAISNSMAELGSYQY